MEHHPDTMDDTATNQAPSPVRQTAIKSNLHLGVGNMEVTELAKL